MGGSAGTTKTTSTTGLPGWQQEQYIDPWFQQAKSLWEGGGPQQWPGSVVAPFAGSETTGQQYLEQAAGPLAGFAQYDFMPMLQSMMGKATSNQFLPEMMGAAGNVGNLTGQPFGVGFNQQNLTSGTASAPFYGQNALDYALNLPQNIATDPKIQAAINAAVQPAFRNLTEQVLPNIRTENIASGTYGGSPQSLSQALAAERTTRGAQETGAQMMNAMWSQSMNNALQAQGLGQNYYNTEADRSTRAALGTAALEQRGNIADIDRQISGQEYLASLFGGLYGKEGDRALQAGSLVPEMVDATVAPGQILGGVGAQHRAMDTAQRMEQQGKWNYEQSLPYANLMQYANMVRGPVGGTASTTVEGSPPSGLQQGIAAALAGLGIAPEVLDLLRRLKIINI